MLGDQQGNESITITAGSGRTTLGVASIEPPFELKADEDLTLRVFVDKNIVEVFANDRQAAVVAHDHIRKNPNINLFTKDMDLNVKEIKAWKMKSIYK
jgi:sucrose-6-phosphate hydrolase SacC (GH32 family)